MDKIKINDEVEHIEFPNVRYQVMDMNNRKRIRVRRVYDEGLDCIDHYFSISVLRKYNKIFLPGEEE